MRIISFDGGGIRGLISLYYLQKLLKVKPDLIEKTDFFAGTSTGSILAAGFAHGKTVDELIKFYENAGPKIFEDSFFDDLKDGFGLSGAQYSNTALKKATWDMFGNYELGDLQKKILIPAFCLDNMDAIDRKWKPIIYNNFGEKYLKEKIRDVCGRSSAAPLFFPSYQNFYDGGLICNNPGMCALAELYKNGFETQEILFLSFGTGIYNKYVPGVDLDYGLIKLAPILIDMILDGSSQLVDFQLKQILKERYFRINPKLDSNYALDDAKQIPKMKKLIEDLKLSEKEIQFIQNF